MKCGVGEETARHCSNNQLPSIARTWYIVIRMKRGLQLPLSVATKYENAEGGREGPVPLYVLNKRGSLSML